MKIARQRIAEREKIVQRRIKHKSEPQDEPMFRARNILYEFAERTKAICYGGIGIMHSLARQSSLSSLSVKNDKIRTGQDVKPDLALTS